MTVQRQKGWDVLGPCTSKHAQACIKFKQYKAFPPKLSSMFSLKCALTRQQYKMCLSESAASSKIAASSACCVFTWNAVVWGWIAVLLKCLPGALSMGIAAMATGSHLNLESQ